MKRLLVVAFTVVLASACGSSSSPSAPSSSSASTTTTPTRVIVLSGSLGFGTVQVGASASATLTISNQGNATLTITSVTGPNTDIFSASTTSGSIPPGGSLAIVFTCRPKAQQVYSGTITVVGDQTSGSNQTAIACGGTLTGVPLFSQSGSGNNVFTVPASVSRVHVTGHFVDNGSTSNFIVRFNGSLIINEILRTVDYDGVHLTTGGGTIEITNSASIRWTFTEVR